MARTPILESAVMEACWTADDWLTVEEIRTAVGRDLAISTVNTVLARLIKKGRLERIRRGRAFAYRATVTWEEEIAERLDRELRSARDRNVALLTFVDLLSVDEKETLRERLEGT